MVTITYENKTFIENNPSNPDTIVLTCSCGNEVIVPVAMVELGLVDGCGHCGREFPKSHHEEALLVSYIELIEGETEVEL